MRRRIPIVLSSSSGRNFCVLQVSPVEALTEIPEVTASRLAADLTTLLDAADEYDDLHDTVCRVGSSRRYALHSFVLASGSETLAKQLKFAETINPTHLDIEDIESVIFEQIVRYLYTRSCDLLVPGPCKVTLAAKKLPPVALQSDDNENFITVGEEEDPYSVSAFAAYSEQRNRGKKKNNRKQEAGEDITSPVTSAVGKSASNPLVLLQEAARSLGIAGLVKIIDCFRSVQHRRETQ